MKNSKEILDTVLEMRDEYFARQRRRKKLIFRSASLLSAAAVIAVVIGISSPGPEVIAPPEIEIAEEAPAVTSVKSASQTSPASSQQTQTAVNKTTYTTSKAVVTEAAADSSVQAKSEVRTSVSADIKKNTTQSVSAQAPTQQVRETERAAVTTAVHADIETVTTMVSDANDVKDKDIAFYVVIGDNRHYISGIVPVDDTEKEGVAVRITEDNQVYIDKEGVSLPPFTITDEEGDYYRQVYGDDEEASESSEQ